MASAPSGLDKDQIFGMAEQEMEYRVELFSLLRLALRNALKRDIKKVS